jgi:hypothetical protein
VFRNPFSAASRNEFLVAKIEEDAKSWVNRVRRRRQGADECSYPLLAIDHPQRFGGIWCVDPEWPYLD